MFFFRLYFANSGLKTHLNLLNTGRAWWTLLVLILSASIAKIVPVTIATKLFTQESWSYCCSMGVIMNTRGIVQLVVLNIGVEYKVISPIIFAMFVFMATILTFFTSLILSILYRRNFDRNILDESNTDHDSYLISEGETNLQRARENIIPMSTSEYGPMSNAPTRANLSVSMNHRPSFSRTSSNRESDQSMLHSNLHSRRYSRMTLF